MRAAAGLAAARSIRADIAARRHHIRLVMDPQGRELGKARVNPGVRPTLFSGKLPHTCKPGR